MRTYSCAVLILKCGKLFTIQRAGISERGYFRKLTFQQAGTSAGKQASGAGTSAGKHTRKQAKTPIKEAHMATQVFSARADADKLKYADNIARRECGMSFAQYCGTVVLNNVCERRHLPVSKEKMKAEEIERKKKALRDIQEIAESLRGTDAENLTDEQVKWMIRNREI